MSSRPPSLLRRLLSAILPRGAVREGLVGDLDELYRERRRVEGRRAADAWYASQVVVAVLGYLPRRAGLSGGDGAGRGVARDLRLAARSLRRSPAFTSVAVLTLALGIGSITAMFTVLEQVVLRPLPVEDQEEIVVVWNDHLVREMSHYPVFGAAFELVEEEAATFTSVAASQWGHPGEVLVEDAEGGTDVFNRTSVAGDFFGVLGVRAVIGRTLRPEDDVLGADPVAVISHGLWQDRYGGGHGAVGARLTIGEIRYRVVGVLPEGFRYPGETHLWTPLRPGLADWAGEGPPPVELDLVGRLAPGAGPAAATAELKRIYAESPEAGAYEGVEPVVRPLSDVVLGDLRPTLFLLFGGAVLVLVVACLNVGNLVLVRAAGREGALAVRRALGASGWRLSREALAEGLVLGSLGGMGGAAFAYLAIRFVLPLAPAGSPRLDAVGPDPLAHLFVVGLTVGTVLLLALLPVMWATRTRPAAVLRAGGRSAGAAAGRGRKLMVLGQTGLAVWAVAAGALLLRSLVNLQALDPGFSAEDVTLVELHQPYPLFQPPPDLPDRMRRVAERLKVLPWVDGVTSTFLRPMAAAGGVALVGRREGQSMEEAMEANPSLNVEVVGPDYFRLLRLPIVEGRGFGPGDREGTTAVAVLNRAAARALWPAASPLGDRLMGIPGGTEWTVVGVAEDARYQSLTDILPTVYVPLEQAADFPPRYLLVRTSGEGPLLATLDAAFEEVDPAIRVKGVSSLRARMEAPLARPRFSVLLLGGLGGATLLLATVGVYGVMAARVRARTGEMGVRIALGARPGGVRALVLREGMAVAAIGAVAGAAAVLLSGGLLERLLFGVSATDPWSLTAAAALVLGAAALACWIPARRAARLDPARTLRDA